MFYTYTVNARNLLSLIQITSRITRNIYSMTRLRNCDAIKELIAHGYELMPGEIEISPVKLNNRLRYI